MQHVFRVSEHLILPLLSTIILHVRELVERRGVYRVLAGKPEGKRLLERPKRRW
jgi:hypothetical protein